jgi:hypothetical protein
METPPQFNKGYTFDHSTVKKILGRFPRNPGSDRLTWFYELKCHCGNIYKQHQDNIKRQLKDRRPIKCKSCVAPIAKKTNTNIYINWGYDPSLPMSKW